MLPFYRYMVIWRDLYTVHGGFVNWGYEGLGAFAITNEMWNDDQLFQSQEARRGPAFGGGAGGGGAGAAAQAAAAPRRNAPSDDATLQDDYVFDQLVLAGATFVPWHKVPHPQYGEVELGGFKKMTGRVPPGFMIEEMLHRNALFCVYQAEQMPQIEIEETTVDKTGDGLYTVSATLKNKHRMPSRSALASSKKMGSPICCLWAARGSRSWPAASPPIASRRARSRSSSTSRGASSSTTESHLSGGSRRAGSCAARETPP